MKKSKKILFKALKIALGSSIAIYIATLLNLDNAISAGTITLLTIVSTKWDTVKLSLFRLVTLVTTILTAWIIFTNVPNEWIAFGIFVFFVVIICEVLGWGATISVNAVVGAHLLMEMQFDFAFIVNEALLVIIGITLAVILNLFNDNKHTQKNLINHMRSVEEGLQTSLRGVAQYLYNQEMPSSVWDDIVNLEESIREYINDAREYQDNTFSSHPGYYIDYFEMRLGQCSVLHNLHDEMKHIRNIPAQAKIVADYILYMAEYVIEIYMPSKQLKRLGEIFGEMKTEPLPESRDEFESRAVLYHILMDLEDFLVIKQRFVEELNEKQLDVYWRG